MKKFQFTHEPETRAGRRAMVMKRAFAIILGSFYLETSRAFPQHSLRHGSRAVSEGSPEARRLFRWRPAADGKDWGSKEGQSRRKSRMWPFEVGPRWPSSPGATRVQNRRWQSPECCQRARMNRGDLFLSRCALPERGVQREWPLLLLMGKNLF